MNLAEIVVLNIKVTNERKAILLRDKSSMETWEYLISTIYFSLLFRFIYNGILFRCLDGMSLRHSRLILWGLMLFTVMVSVLFTCKYHMTFFSSLLTAFLPFGLYTLIINGKLLGTLCWSVFFICGVFLLFYHLLVLFRKIKGNRNREKIIRYRLYKCIHMTHVMFAVSTTLVMAIFLGALIWGESLVLTNTKAETGEEYTIQNQLDTLQALKPDTWFTLSAREKLNVLQTIANIEATYLGLPGELTVSTAIIEENTLGEYSANNRMIYINADHLEESGPRDLMTTVCHEAYHGYQHYIIEAYQNADEQFKNLLLFYDASIYEEEFANYDDGSEGLENYYKQYVEIDAREYADRAAAEYYHYLYPTSVSEQ